MEPILSPIYHHGQRVGALCVALAEVLGLGACHVGKLRRAAELHDIGKLALSPELLQKPGTLDAMEWQAVRRHPKLGYQLLRQEQDSAANLASIVALQHHEYWDGSGYPGGLRGEAISREARIVALCDVYDALREERTYKPAMSHDQALRLILDGDNSGRIRPAMFDPALLMVLRTNAGAFRVAYDNALLAQSARSPEARARAKAKPDGQADRRNPETTDVARLKEPTASGDGSKDSEQRRPSTTRCSQRMRAKIAG